LPADKASEKIPIIGIGDDGLAGVTESARRLIEQAEVLVGATPALTLVPESGAERITLGGDIDEAARQIDQLRGKRVVVLANGDPLFYGMARFLCARLGKDRFEVVPHVSSMQLAFARVKESWEDAYLTDLTTRPLESVIERIRTAETVGLFTSDQAPPATVVQALLDRRIDYFHAYVCENLGSPDERVTQGELAEIAQQEFAPLNVMILVRKPNVPDRPVDSIGRRLFGNPDERFLQSQPKQGLLTPAEIRSMVLAELDLGPMSVLWDVGAGSGSVAIEAAQIAQQGRVYAIEQDIDDHRLIVSNCERFGVHNVVPVLGRAPEIWEGLPDPDAIFVGGSGREIRRLVDLAFVRLKVGGRLAANVGSIESLSEIHDALLRRGADVQVWMINLARGTYQLERIRFDALNPSFMLSTVKPA
jgi:precorrin-6Y C5,15-methyltransferase (decarboxylating)